MKKIYFYFISLLILFCHINILNMETKTQAEEPIIKKNAYSFSNLSEWFSIPEFKEGTPIAHASHKYVIDHFGNKTFNLCVLNVVAQKINKEALTGSNNKMAVPKFIGISHQDIANYLNSSINLNKFWQEFSKEQGESKDLDLQASKTLEEIRSKIAQEFKDPERMPTIIKNQIQDFVKDYKGTLMVRSSGDEDRKDIANAGGNESVPCVEATLKAIWQAMGIVVQSYFSEKSLKQRLLVGDNITKRFFIPVLLQYMIGEPMWSEENPASLNAIPVSGVMFTQEAEGNTPGVTQIQTAYGHNQGVVNSLVSVDTFYIGFSGIIHPIIRKKSERLVSVKSDHACKLEAMPNYVLINGKKDFSMQKNPSLQPPIVFDLKRIADFIQNLYGIPMDIEFVIMKNSTHATINLVQARPIVRKTYTKEPNYVSDVYIEKLKSNQLLQGTSLVLAGGFIHEIKEEDQLIMLDELPQALNEYHDNPERSKIEGVVVKKMAPATSHEATQFRGYSVPVLVTKSDAQTIVEQWLQNTPILLDTQRALLVQDTREIEKVGSEEKKRTEEKSIFESGWYTHPIPMQTSIIKKFAMTSKSAIFSTYKKYIEELKWQLLDKDNANISNRTLLQEIKKTTNREILLSSLKRLIKRIGTLTKSKQITQLLLKTKAQEPQEKQAAEFMQEYIDAGEESLLSQAQLIAAQAITCSAEILYTFDNLNAQAQTDQSKRLLYLYPIKFLEATLLQQADDQIINSYSYLQLRKMLQEDMRAVAALLPTQGKKEKEIVKVDPQTIQYIVQLEKIDKLALNNTIQKEWQEFVQNLLKSAEIKNKKERIKKVALIRKFSTTIAQLQKLDVLDLWINTSFAKIASEAQKSPLDAAKKLVDEIEGEKESKKTEKELSNQDVINWVNQKKNIVTTWQNKVDEWGNPDTQTFNRLFDSFDKNFVREFISGTDNVAQKAFGELMFTNNHQIAQFDEKKWMEFAEQHAPLIKKFTAAPDLGKLILLRFMHELIEVYDKTIKGLTGSPLYKDSKDAQAQRFAQLLVAYLSLVEQMVTLVKNYESELMMTVEPFGKWTFSKYLLTIRSLFAQYFNESKPSHLNASTHFIVSAAQIGSKVDFNRTQPESLEDIFTLAHQNMSMIISILNKIFGIKRETLPLLVQSICTTLDNVKIFVEHENLRASLIGIDYNYPRLTVYYNLPLRQHSSKFDIEYNVNKPDQAILICQFLGHNEFNRMNGIAAYALLASIASHIQFEKIPYSTAQGSAAGHHEPHLTEFSWIITQQTSLEEITKYLELFGKESMGFHTLLEGMFKNIDSIKHFLPSKWNILTKEKNFKELSTEERKEIIAQASPIINNPLLDHSLFFNDWFIRLYMDAGMYDKALELIQTTLHKIIKSKKLLYHSSLMGSQDPQLMLEFCFQTLDKLLKNPEAQNQAIALILDIFSKTIDMLFKPFPDQFTIWRDPRVTMLNLVLLINQIKPSSAALKILDYMATNKHSVKILLNNEKLTNAIAIIISKQNKENQIKFITTIFEQTVKEAQKEIDLGKYDMIESTVNYLLQYAKEYPIVATYILNLVQNLIKAQTIYKGPHPIFPHYEREKIERPGAQYMFAGLIAETLIYEGQKKVGQEIIDELRDIYNKLKNMEQKTEKQKTELTALTEILKRLVKFIPTELSKELFPQEPSVPSEEMTIPEDTGTEPELSTEVPALPEVTDTDIQLPTLQGTELPRAAPDVKWD